MPLSLPVSLEAKSDAVSAVAVEPQVAQLLADTSLPEPVRRFLQSGATLESIYLDAEGRWFHQGEPFVNEALALLFTRSLVRTAGGTWMLSIPPFSYPVQVLDTPRFVRSVRLEPAAPGSDKQQVWLLLSDDTEEALQPQTLRYVEDRGLYCQLHSGLCARLLRPAYFSLAEHLEPVGSTESPSSYELTLGSSRTPVPVCSWPEARERAETTAPASIL